MSNAKSINFSRKVVFLGGQPVTLPQTSSDPIDAVNGDMYYNVIENKIKVYQNNVWSFLPSANDTSIIVIDNFTLTTGNISTKSVTLSATPVAPEKTILNVIGGPVQEYGVDYTISGNILSWSALGLESLLTDGDKLIVQFG